MMSLSLEKVLVEWKVLVISLQIYGRPWSGFSMYLLVVNRTIPVLFFFVLHISCQEAECSRKWETRNFIGWNSSLFPNTPRGCEWRGYDSPNTIGTIAMLCGTFCSSLLIFRHRFSELMAEWTSGPVAEEQIDLEKDCSLPIILFCRLSVLMCTLQKRGAWLIVRLVYWSLLSKPSQCLFLDRKSVV